MQRDGDSLAVNLDTAIGQFRAVNRWNFMAGWKLVGSVHYAVVYTPENVFVDLGPREGQWAHEAIAINNNWLVAGWTTDGLQKACSWTWEPISRTSITHLYTHTRRLTRPPPSSSPVRRLGFQVVWHSRHIASTRAKRALFCGRSGEMTTRDQPTVNPVTARDKTSEVTESDIAAKEALAVFIDGITRRIRAQHGAVQAIGVAKPPWTGLGLSVDGLDPSPIVENRPALAYFTIYNGTFDEQPAGSVSAEILPLHGINPLSGSTTFSVPKMKPFDIVCGVISFVAPRSDTGNTLRLKYSVPGPLVAEFPTENVLATVDHKFAIAGRYRLLANQISISDTASRHEDTLYMALSGVCGTAMSNEHAFLGDHNNGTFALEFTGLGPFDSVPGVSPPAVINYLLINNGHSDDADKILNDISDASAAAVTLVATILYGPAVGAAAGLVSTAIDALMHVFHDNLFKDCDCQLINNSQALTSQDLYDKTFDNADLRTSFQAWDSQDGTSPCDHWRYKVGWEVVRLRAPSDVAWLSPAYASVPFSAVVGLTASDSTPGPLGRIGWEWDVVAGSGRVDESGQFKAPDAPQLCNYGVVRARRLGSQDREVKSTGYSIVQFG
jgi:hypothetical protein